MIYRITTQVEVALLVEADGVLSALAIAGKCRGSEIKLEQGQLSGIECVVDLSPIGVFKPHATITKVEEVVGRQEEAA